MSAPANVQHLLPLSGPINLPTAPCEHVEVDPGRDRSERGPREPEIARSYPARLCGWPPKRHEDDATTCYQSHQAGSISRRLASHDPHPPLGQAEIDAACRCRRCHRSLSCGRHAPLVTQQPRIAEKAVLAQKRRSRRMQR